MRWISRLITAFTSEDRVITRRSDPDFGEMWRNTHDIWRSHLPFPPMGDEVSLYFRDGDDSGPTQWQRSQFHELCDRYNSLRQDMAEPLWREYEKIRASWMLTSEVIREPKDIWRIVHLFAIEISGEGSPIDISLDHSIDWENENHDLNVRLKNWKVLEVEMEG